MAVSLVFTGAAGAEALARLGSGENGVVLMTEACMGGDRPLQRAQRQRDGRTVQGCWAVNARGNPVVTWNDGPVQELDARRVQLEPKFAAALQAIDSLEQAGREALSAGVSFSRPAWCKDARAPHERLICRDPELAADDLALAPLWRAFKTRHRLSEAEQAPYKSGFYRRLKRCGADKHCIAAEQAAQARFYRQALGLG